MCFEDYPALDDCKNIEESYGDICVHCNKCGRFNKNNGNLKELIKHE